jgi:NTP pyrophosphatase (non-canonical NTP hydrolase)
MPTETKLDIAEFMKAVHENAINHGWYEEPRTFGDMIALIHSEASEALEEFRSGHALSATYYSKDAQGYDKPEGIPAELADVIIRVLDTCAYYNIDIAGALLEKHHYNTTRPYKHGNKVI